LTDFTATECLLLPDRFDKPLWLEFDRRQGILRRLMALIRNSFAKTRIRVRLDGGFANPNCRSSRMASRVSNMRRQWPAMRS
jgi:uncharacterized protein (DUF2236 family)